MYPVIIKQLEKRRVAGVLHLGAYQDIAEAFARLNNIIAAQNLFAEAQGMIGIYHDAPGSKPEAQLRSHAAVMIADDFPLNIEGLDYFDVEGGKYAVMAHKGPYATFPAAYEWLYGTWLPQSGEQVRAAPPFELYLNHPGNAAPEDLRTDVCVPLAG